MVADVGKAKTRVRRVLSAVDVILIGPELKLYMSFETIIKPPECHNGVSNARIDCIQGLQRKKDIHHKSW